MKLISHFDDFLKDTVNLNQSRIDVLEERVKTIKSFIRSSSYGPTIIEFSQQGSWAHKTIIKPKKGKEFDADILVIVKAKDDWEASDYVETLYSTFRSDGTYKEMVSRGTRCVTIDYAGDFHLDIVPCVESTSIWNGTEYNVCNRTLNTFEKSDSKAFATWVNDKNQKVKRNHFRKVVKLSKYLRDTKGTFSAKSVLLTTLLGNQVGFLDTLLADSYYPDLPTSLRTLVNSLDDHLQENPIMPAVENPTLPEETFDRHWDQGKYENFRTKFHTYRDWIDDAFTEPEKDESIRKWRRVFGSNFAKGVEIKEAKSVAKAVLNEETSTISDLFAAIEKFGVLVLNKMPVTLPHIELPKWKKNLRNLPLRVTAAEFKARKGDFVRTYVSGQFIKPHRSIRFRVSLPTGMPSHFDVKAQVVNTGEDAANTDGGLRGQIIDASTDHWEDTQYIGVHWIQFFIINGRTGECICESERFFVAVR